MVWYPGGGGGSGTGLWHAALIRERGKVPHRVLIFYSNGGSPWLIELFQTTFPPVEGIESGFFCLQTCNIKIYLTLELFECLHKIGKILKIILTEYVFSKQKKFVHKALSTNIASM